MTKTVASSNRHRESIKKQRQCKQVNAFWVKNPHDYPPSTLTEKSKKSWCDNVNSRPTIILYDAIILSSHI